MEDSYHIAEPTPEGLGASRGLWSILLRRKWIVLQVTGALFAIALVVALLQPRSYSATGWLLVTASSGSGGGGESRREANTQIDVWGQLQNDMSMHIRMLGRREIAAAVIAELKLDKTPGELQGNISAAKVPGATANLLALNYRDADPAVAQKIVNAWGKAYEADNLTRREAATVSAIQYVERQIDAVGSQLGGIEQQIATLERNNLVAGIGANGGAAAATLNNLLTALASTRVEEASLRAQVVQTQGLLSLEPVRVQETEEQPTLATRATQEQLAQLHLRLEQMRTDYYEDSPEITALKAQIVRLEEQLAQSSELTQTLVKTSGNPTRAKARDQLITLQGQLHATQARAGALQQQIAAQRGVALRVPGTNVLYNELNRKLTALTAVQASLLSRLYDLQLQKAMAAPAVQMVKAAELPNAPVQPPLHMIVGLGLLMGLLAGIVLAVVFDQLDDTFSDVSEVEETVSQRVVGALPHTKSSAHPSLPILDAPRAPFANAVRMLASSVHIEMERSRCNSLLVTSTGRGEGKSMVAANLAIALANAGHKVVLVDCDLHRPVLHRILEAPNTVGLSSVLTGAVSVAAAQQATRIDNLFLISSGPIPPSPLDLLANEFGNQKLTEINALDAVVIWDTPPSAILADATIVGTSTDRALFVVSHKTKRRMLRHALRNLQAAGIRLLGLVTDQLSQCDDASYYYYYYDAPAPAEQGEFA